MKKNNFSKKSDLHKGILDDLGFKLFIGFLSSALSFSLLSFITPSPPLWIRFFISFSLGTLSTTFTHIALKIYTEICSCREDIKSTDKNLKTIEEVTNELKITVKSELDSCRDSIESNTTYIRSKESTIEKIPEYSTFIVHYNKLVEDFKHFSKFIRSIFLDKKWEHLIINSVNDNEYLNLIEETIKEGNKNSYISVFTAPYLPGWFFDSTVSSKNKNKRQEVLNQVERLTREVVEKYRLLIFEEGALLKSFQSLKDDEMEKFINSVKGKDVKVYWYKGPYPKKCVDSALIDGTVIVKRTTNNQVEFKSPKNVRRDGDISSILQQFNDDVQHGQVDNQPSIYVSLEDFKKEYLNIKNEKNEKSTIN